MPEEMPSAKALVPMDGLDWIGFAVGVAIGLYGTITYPTVVRVMWRGEHKWIRKPMPTWWLWGGPLWRGWVRAGLVWGPAFLPLLLAVVLGTFVDEGSALVPLIYVLIALSALLAFLLVPAIVLLARPRALIPPPLRNQPGAIREWIDGPRRDARSP